MPDFPPWTGPEAVRRLNANASTAGFYEWPNHAGHYAVIALQQLMVDLNMPEPVDEAEELWEALDDAGDEQALPLIRAFAAKIRGECHDRP